jgi:hypothetical protein
MVFYFKTILEINFGIMMIYLYTKKVLISVDVVNMAQVNIKRAVVEQLVQKSKEEASIKGKKIETIDPILKTARKLLPFLSDRELQEYSSAALRLILVTTHSNIYQSSLMVNF